MTKNLILFLETSWNSSVTAFHQNDREIVTKRIYILTHESREKNFLKNSIYLQKLTDVFTLAWYSKFELKSKNKR